MFFHVFILKVSLSFCLNVSPCRQHIIESQFCFVVAKSDRSLFLSLIGVILFVFLIELMCSFCV